MRRKKPFGRWKLIPALCLLTSLTSLPGCATTRIESDPCLWARPITFSQPTLDWLGGLKWPAEAYGDFWQITLHNEKYRLLCPNL